MNEGSSRRDLIVLVADQDMEYAVKGLLNRNESLSIRRSITFEIKVHPEHDPGCLNEGHSFLRIFARKFEHAFLMLDYDGCGREHKETRKEIEEELGKLLSINGWGDRASAIVIEPELESWVWVDSPDARKILGWWGKKPDLLDWLVNHEYIGPEDIKPKQPKEAMKRVLRITRKKRSSSIFLQLAQQVDFSGCIDPAFIKFRETLQKWFPRESG